MNNYTEPPFPWAFSGLPSSFNYLGVPPDSVKLKSYSFKSHFKDFLTLPLN